MLFSHLFFNTDLKVPINLSGELSDRIQKQQHQIQQNTRDQQQPRSKKVYKKQQKGISKQQKNQQNFIVVPFNQVQKAIHEDVVSFMSRVGVGSDSFSTSYFSEVFGIYMMTEKSK